MSYYLTDIQNYFEDLSTKHRSVLHGVNSRRAFFRLQSNEQLDNIPNNIGPFLILITQFNGRAAGEYDSHKLQQFVQVRFANLKDIPADGDFDTAIEAVMGDSYLVMMDFISRMKHDFEADSCGWLKHVNFTSMSWNEFQGPWLENHYGWDLTIPVFGSFPVYNGANWTS